MARRPYFSGNYGSALGSTANAANLLARAGETQGKMFANMGAQIGGMIQQYGLNKEKRDKAEASFSGTIARMTKQPGGAERLLVMQNDPVIGKDLKAIQEGQGSMKNFDNVNAYLTADREQEIKALMMDNANLKLAANKLAHNINKATSDNQIRKFQAQTNIAENEAVYKQVNDSTRRKMVEAQTDYTKVKTAQEAFRLLGVNQPPPQEIDKQYKELQNVLPELNKTLIKVRTNGVFGLGSEDKEITYGEYKENPDEYSGVLQSDQLRALQLKEEDIKKRLADLTLKSPVSFVNQETGQSGVVTVEQMLKYQDAVKKQQMEEEERKKNELRQKAQQEYMNTPGVGGAGFPFMP